MYPHQSIEPKWQKYWAERNTFECVNPELENSHKPKFYALDMFPYPSGAGLHVGHPKGYTATDIIARYKHAKGYHVLHPMGWDAFGLPAENYAIKTGTHPAVTTANNINRFREQLQRFGFSFDWNREVDTTDPEYYKWSQWIFLKLFEAGLAYESDKPINFCPSCKTGLANEEVVDGKCERCGTPVEKRPIRQWVLAITKYADRLLTDIDRLDWPEGIKEMQRNWIGRSEGCEFKMHKTPEKKQKILILHGFGGSSNENWLPWIANKFKNYNTNVIMPSLVESNVPNLEKHMEQLAQYADWVDEDTIIIGHSLGAMTALNFIATHNLKIKKFIAVGPVFETIDMEGLCSNSENITKVRDEFQTYLSSSQIDYQAAQHNIGEVVTYLSKTDPYIPLETARKEYQAHFPKCSFKIFEDKGHFNTKANILQFPEILDDILDTMSVYTTRIDTVYGMTYVVMAPDHPAVAQFITSEHEKECLKYIEKTKSESDQDRTNEKKEKTGVFTGSYVVNPYNSEKVPVWIADYVLGNYGTGAVMAVPAHDERDWDFAKKYGLEIKQSIAPFFTNTTGEYAPRNDKKDEQRDLLLALLKHHTEDKYLCLDWKKTTWKSFISGGTDGESLENSGKREIQEETGYTNVRFIRSLGKQKQYFFTGSYKDVNRIGFVEAGLFELIDDTQENVSSEELEKHTPTWIEADKILDFINLDTNKYFWNKVIKDSAFTEDGVLVNSGDYDWVSSAEGRIKLTEKAEEEGFGKKVTNYKLRDWIFSRQRYWGEPIPLIHISEEDKKSLPTTHNDDCWVDGEVLKKGEVTLGKLYQGIDSWILPDYTLPLKLPEVEKYEPSGDGQSPLATIPDWVNVRLGNNLVGKRETNTMPQWAGSCWYYLRYMDPKNSEAIVDPAVVKYWGEVDSYIGGAEHAVLHLLYARFWHKFLFDIGVVPSDEPFFKLRNVGLILGPDGEKMSKSKGNVINPDEVIEEYGADTLRMYEMSMADFSDVSPWNTKAIIGNYRLLEKIHRLFTADEASEEFRAFLASDDLKAVKTMHKAIKKIGEDIENMKFNTAISMLNVMMNEGAPADAENRQEWKSALARLLHPFAPHMAEECWSLLGNEESIYETEWPEYIEALTVDDEVMIAVQINGKLRGTYPFMRGVAVDEVRTTIESKPEIAKWLEGATILKEIFIPNKILNIVIK